MLRHMRSVAWFALFAVTSLAASQGHAHFILLKPDSWLKEDSMGGPQKGGPCGPGGYDDANPSSPPTSGNVTTVHAGDTVSVSWQVTVPHSGFYRIAVAKDRNELKDPALNPDGLCNFTTPSGPPAYPVLADNIDSAATSQDVKLPADLTCDKCTLQVIMWMTNHPQGCIYYHCADLKILPAGASAGTGGTGGTGAAGSSAASGGSGVSGASGAGGGASGVGAAAGRGVPVLGTGGMVGQAIDYTAGRGGTSAGNPGTTSPAVGAPVGSGIAGTGITGSPAPTKKKSGCSVADGGPAGSMGLLLFTLLALSRRRRAA